MDVLLDMTSESVGLNLPDGANSFIKIGLTNAMGIDYLGRRKFSLCVLSSWVRRFRLHTTVYMSQTYSVHDHCLHIVTVFYCRLYSPTSQLRYLD